MMFLVQEEENVRDMQEPVVVERLAKLLMMAANHRLNVSKLNEVGRSVGLPDGYLIRIIPKYHDMFRVINYSGRKSSMEIELITWDQDLAVSAIEKIAQKEFGLPNKLNVMLLKHLGIFYEGLHEYNWTHHVLNIEKGRKKGMIEMKEAKKDLIHELSDDEEGQGDDLGGICDPEERERFYRILFEDKEP
ncbi:protein WHAT'S THIS FACTOR 1 [Tanacetum coccineum]